MKKRKNEKEIGQYRKSWNYFKESKNYIIFAIGIFLLFFLIGFLFPVFFTEQITKILEQLVRQVEGKNAVQIISFIFLNNLKASFLSLFLGLFLCLFPLSALIVNGYVAGFVSRTAVSKEGILILWRLFPHGIFELPAVLVSMGLGLKLGMIPFKGKKDMIKEIKKELIDASKFFILIIIPLLIIAAIIEGALIFFIG